MKEIKFYHCSLCGNLVALVNESGGTLTCCNKEMSLLKAGVVEASLEKHLPFVTRKGNSLHVQIGELVHPMTPEHHIGWIAVWQNEKLQLQKLDVSAQPVAEFEIGDGPATVYEWCNLHGLWSKEV